MIVPQPFGSEKSWKEVKAWSCVMHRSLFQSKACEEFLDDMMNHPPFSKVQPPPLLKYDIRSNYSYEKLIEETENLRLPFIITGFDDNGMEKFKTFDSVKENMVNNNYSFEVLLKGSNSNFQESADLPLHDAMDRMKLQKDLYLRFSIQLAMDNPDLDKAMVDILDRTKVKSDMKFDGADLRGAPRVGRLCFLGYGSGFTTLHNAWMDNWFVQVAGVKKWRILAPEYAPYIHPKPTPTTPASKAEILNIPDDSPLPYLDFTTTPGDLFYFPAFWWHEVYNVGEDMNIGCGYRPMVLTLQQAASTLALPPVASHRNDFKNFLVTFPCIIRKAISVATEGGANAMKWWKKAGQQA